MAITRVPPVEAEAFGRRLLARAGFSEANASAVVDSLIWAETREVTTHGLQRLLDYVERAENGELDPAADPVVRRSSGAITVVDGRSAPGQRAFSVAAAEALELARELGVGWVAVGNCSHAGALGFVTEQIAAAGLIGVALVSSRPTMGYPGAIGPVVGTNPIAIAVPAADGIVSFDMSPASITRGAIKRHRRDGTPLPPGVAASANGAPTTDPEAATTILPIGGAKGGVMALMFEFLGGVLAGAPVLAPALAGRNGPMQAGSVVAIDQRVFGDSADGYGEHAEQLLTALRSAPASEPGVSVRAPGDRAREAAARIQRDGIQVSVGLQRQLDELADRLLVGRLSGVAT